MKKYLLPMLLCLLSFLSYATELTLDAKGIPVYISGTYFYDYTGNFVSTKDHQLIEDKLRTYRDSTSTHIVVIVLPDFGTWDRAQLATEIGHVWKLGTKEKDNGIVFLISRKGPHMFIATGRGIEGDLPDAIVKRIITKTIMPEFKNERYYEGISYGLDKMALALAGVFETEKPQESEDSLVWFLVVCLIVLIVATLLTIPNILLGIIAGGSGVAFATYYFYDPAWQYILIAFVAGAILTIIFRVMAESGFGDGFDGSCSDSSGSSSVFDDIGGDFGGGGAGD